MVAPEARYSRAAHAKMASARRRPTRPKMLLAIVIAPVDRLARFAVTAVTLWRKIAASSCRLVDPATIPVPRAPALRFHSTQGLPCLSFRGSPSLSDFSAPSVSAAGGRPPSQAMAAVLSLDSERILRQLSGALLTRAE